MVSGVTLVAPAVLPSGGAASPRRRPLGVRMSRWCSHAAPVSRSGSDVSATHSSTRCGRWFPASPSRLRRQLPGLRDFLRAAEGANDASAFVQNTVATCPDTKIVLGGYSQGAAVIDAIAIADQPTLGFTNPMPAAVADHVAAVAVFGNPSIRLLGGPLTALSPRYGYKTIDLCNGADPVCSSGDDRPAHSLYVEAGLTTQAAQFVAGRLTTEAPISTLASQTTAN